MTIESGKVVALAYVLKDSAGTILDQADSNSPFEYLHGMGQVVPGLEKALTGLARGDVRAIHVPAHDGYGLVEPDLILTLQRDRFPDPANLKVGMQFQAQSPEGDALWFTIKTVGFQDIEVDGNHPLAGQDLYFDVEVLGVRDASPEERAHGHAHGPDSHHH
jgi:FKBP-type peptidyl-prolyl cis-trans isomerase SlyD